MDDLQKKQEVALRDWSHLLADVAHKPPEGAYGYEAALWATGVRVLAYEEFGSYQGDWWMKVQFPDGKIAFLNDYFGSCSGCDAFEGEIGWGDDDSPDYLHRLKDFGRNYLTDCSTYDQAIERASKHGAWDTSANTIVEWIKAQGSGPAPTN